MTALIPRSYLFVPGNRPERFAKTLASGADCVVMDLEDAVAAQAKPSARDAITRWATSASPADKARCVVRINDAASTHFADDLGWLPGLGLAGVMLPKAERPADIAAVVTATASGLTDPPGDERRGDRCGDWSCLHFTDTIPSGRRSPRMSKS